MSLSSPTSQIKQLRASEIKDLSSKSSGKQTGGSISSQRRSIASAPTSDRNPILSLAHPAYDLPQKLPQNFSALGINSIYSWQSKCLVESKLLHSKGNLVSADGKSLAADLLILKHIVDNPHKKAILILPYVSLVQEKLYRLRRAVDGVRRETIQDQHPSVQP